MCTALKYKNIMGRNFDYDEKCGKNDCMKCVDICPGNALVKK